MKKDEEEDEEVGCATKLQWMKEGQSRIDRVCLLRPCPCPCPYPGTCLVPEAW
jgi:hypothetical protein